MCGRESTIEGLDGTISPTQFRVPGCGCRVPDFGKRNDLEVRISGVGFAWSETVTMFCRNGSEDFGK